MNKLYQKSTLMFAALLLCSTWVAAVNLLPTGRVSGHSFTTTVLKSGSILIVGGYNTNKSLNTARVYSPSTNAITPTGIMENPVRVWHTSTLLANGKVLVAGGAIKTGLTASAEIYDPTTNSFTATGAMAKARYVHTATLLPNGKVLMVGGAGQLSTAELYDPAKGRFTSHRYDGKSGENLAHRYATGGVFDLGTAATSGWLLPGRSEQLEVVFAIPDGPSIGAIVVSATVDEDGLGGQQYNECDDENNAAAVRSAELPVGRVARNSQFSPGDHGCCPTGPSRRILTDPVLRTSTIPPASRLIIRQGGVSDLGGIVRLCEKHAEYWDGLLPSAIRLTRFLSAL